MGNMHVRYHKDLEHGCDHTFTLWTLVELVETGGLLVQTSVAFHLLLDLVYFIKKQKDQQFLT